MLAPPSDYREEPSWPPQYKATYSWRLSQIAMMRDDPKMIVGAKKYYKNRPGEFINHWCNTFDPRNAGSGRLVKFPFLLFKRQHEFIDFLYGCLTSEENGLVEKCRDMGATWGACCFSIWLWLFWPGSSVGWGSRKEQLVDRIGDVDSIFEKMRMVLNGLPKEFLPNGFVAGSHIAYMKFINPENAATITGESGDNIGRGGRKLIYFKDESAHYEHPESIEAALTDNTRCQIDISSVNGLGNVFHRRREAGIEWVPGGMFEKGATRVFVMDWRDHPGKTQEWYDARRRKAVSDGLLHIFEQEVNRNYSASIDGTIINNEWVLAAIDADKKLGLNDSGAWGAALDVADGGSDNNALVTRKGIIVKKVEEWGERDTGNTARRAVGACRGLGIIDLQYDCIGVGSGIKAETNRLADEGALPLGVRLVPWNAGAAVQEPRARVIPDDTDSIRNEDFYSNLKAQGWWQLARRFERTWRALNEPGFTWDPEQLISLPSDLPLLRKLQKELCQVTAKQGSRLKLVIEKAPEGTRSPNLGDAVMMAFWPVKPFFIPEAATGSYQMVG